MKIKTYQNMYDATEEVAAGKVITLNVHIKKEERYKNQECKSPSQEGGKSEEN